MTGALKQIWDDVAGLWSLIVGLKVTGSYFVRPQVTVHYPRHEVKNLATFRGPIELVENPDNPGRPKCIACMTCATICPHECITLERIKPPKKDEGASTEKKGAEKPPVKKKAPKGPARFIYDYTRCCLCGSCVENCPVQSIRFSDRGYLAGPDKNAFIFDLLAGFTATAFD